MLNELEYEELTKSEEEVFYGKGGGGALSLVTTFAIVAIVTIVIYKLYKSKTGDITLPGGYKFKFTT